MRRAYHMAFSENPASGDAAAATPPRAQPCAETRSRRAFHARLPAYKLCGRLTFTPRRDYNGIMARGWQSKSVEAQIDMAEDPQRSAVIENTLDPERLRSIRLKETILLS